MGPLSSGKRCACPTKKERGEPAYLFGFTVCLAALLSFFCLAALLAFACFCAACLFLVFGDLSPIGSTLAEPRAIANAGRKTGGTGSVPSQNNGTLRRASPH